MSFDFAVLGAYFVFVIGSKPDVLLCALVRAVWVCGGHWLV